MTSSYLSALEASIQSVPTALTQAARTLLGTPLLTEGMDGFRETYAWRTELRAFFARTAALTVQIGPGVLRLVLPPPFPEGGRAWDGLKSPRAAALVVWTLWYHEYLGVRLGEVAQFSLSELAAAIAANSGAGDLDFSVLADRRALLQAIRTLAEVGALRVLDEDASRWEGGADEGLPDGGALLEFSPAAPYLISLPPPLPVTPAQRAVRALLCGPALTRAQDEGAFAVLADTETVPELAEVQRTLGWTLDVHGPYALLLREGVTHGLAARWAPGRSVPGAAALLLLRAVRAEVEAGKLRPDAQGRLTLSQTRLYTLLDGVRDEYRSRWGEQGKQGGEKLLSGVLQLWREWGGVARMDEGSLTLEPHLARFDAGYEDEGRTLLTPARRGRRKG
ncbi:DUF2398 family protein [Deinococcus marmoris]|uniref:DUF2398 family protein n=1 Tax=Deinococcus marmoris TaxID=249408 RepID=UPI0004971D9C|nr:DUF2398 family protein [Deinococcus marmoris]